MARAGDWSYGFYLRHYPVLCLLALLDRHAIAQLGTSLLLPGIGEILFIGLTVGISAWGYRHLEVPARDWLRARHRSA